MHRQTRVSKREQAIVQLSVAVLNDALKAAETGVINTPAVRLALRCLLPHCPENWPLTCYWDSSAQDNVIGRTQGCTAALNGIMRQLRKSEAWTS
jgi:hypothetical protein